MDITIRNIDETAYRKLKAKAALENINIGTAVAQAIDAWLGKSESKTENVSILDIKPVKMGKKNKNLSEEIDKVLYGAN